MPESAKPRIVFKVMAHEVPLILPCKFTQEEELNGQTDWNAKEIMVSNRTNNGTKRPLTAVLHTVFHELNHTWSEASGHEIFESEDEAEQAKKEKANDTFSEVMLQTMLESDMLNPAWVDKIADLADD